MAVAPVIPDPGGNKFLDSIRPEPNSGSSRRRRDVALVPLAVVALRKMFGQHPQLSNHGGQFAIARSVKCKLDIALSGLSRLSRRGYNMKHITDQLSSARQARKPLRSPVCRRASELRCAADRPTHAKSSGRAAASASSPYSVATSSCDRAHQGVVGQGHCGAIEPFTLITAMLKL
jgi:hypothetical protein